MQKKTDKLRNELMRRQDFNKFEAFKQMVKKHNLFITENA